MLAAAQANIPPELRQCLEIVPGSIKPLTLPNINKQNEMKPIVKFLTCSSGLATEYQAVYCGNILVIKRSHQQATVYDFSLSEGAEIVDVEYLQTAEGRFGLAVLYNDGNDAYLARLVHSGEKLKPVHESVIPFPGSCLKVVLDDIEIARVSEFLNRRMQHWTNVVVVGTELGHAYVLYLPNNHYWTHKSPPETRKLTDALSFCHRDGKFVYNVAGRTDVVKEVVEVRVTAIAYIPRSCDLLIGLSFGGIVQVGITPSGDISTNVFQSSSPVCQIVPILPHDDPNMNVWFWAFHGERGKTLVMVLYEGSYPVIGEENVAKRDREFKKAMFQPRMADQVAGKGTTAEWIAAHPLARERKDLKEERTAEHNSTLEDADLDLSQMFFSYIDARGTLKFGIFDLNTYYYKRLHSRPTPDNTQAKQCPYLIDVPLEPSSSSKMLDKITDIMVDCAYITRFQFMSEDPEQQMYASGMILRTIYVGSSSASATLQLRSLPAQVLERIYKNLNSYTTNWREAAYRLLTVGLMPAPLDIAGGSAMATSALLYGHTSYEMVMTAAILYDFTDSVVQLINSTKEADWSAVRVKCEWMWSEVQRARNKLDQLNDVLFSDTAKQLSLEQKRQLRQLNAVLRAAKCIYHAMHKKYIEWEKSEILPRILVLETESQLAAVNNVSDFANCIRNLYTMKYLPLGERNMEERQILENMVHERRSKLRDLTLPKSLVVDEIVAKMQQIEPNEPFWLDQEGEEWYPPAVHNAVTPLLKATYQHQMKQKFIIYYIIDLVVAKKTLQLGNRRPDVRKVVFQVKEILDDVLHIGENEILAVVSKWHDEQQLIVGETGGEKPDSKPDTESLEEKINSLTRKAEQLTVDEENNLKAMCNKISYGQFRYQLYLIERSRFNELEILTVPANVSNPYVKLYNERLPQLRRVKQFLEPLKRVNNAPQWPPEVIRKCKEFKPSQKPCQVEKETAMLSMPLYKRIRKLQKTAEPEEMEVCQEQDIITTPERSSRGETEDEVTPRMNELDEKTRDKINSILRTPTLRRARAAAVAEGQTGIQVTPETQAFIPAPTSILKTPVRRNMSPGRGRLRWDPEFVEASIDNTTLSSATESPQNMPEMDPPMLSPSFDNTDLSSATESPESRQKTPILVASIKNTTPIPVTMVSPKNTPELADDTPIKAPRRILIRVSETQDDTMDIDDSTDETQPKPMEENSRPLPAVFDEQIEVPKSPSRPVRKIRARPVSESQEVKIRTPRSRTRAVSETVEPPVQTRTTPTRSAAKKKSPPPRPLASVSEETAVDPKSPTRSVRKSRKRSVSETVEPPVRVRTTPTRSCSKTAIGAYAETPKNKSPARRALAAVFEEATVEPKSPTRSPSRRTKTPAEKLDLPFETAKTTRFGRKVVASQSEPMQVKSPSRRTRTTVTDEAQAEPKSPTRKRSRATAKTTGPSLVEQFRANLAKRTAAAKKPTKAELLPS